MPEQPALPPRPCDQPHCYDGTLMFAERRAKNGQLLEVLPLRHEHALAEDASPPDLGAGETVTTSAQPCPQCQPEYRTPEEREAAKITGDKAHKAVRKRDDDIFDAPDEEPPRRSLPYREDD